MRPDAALVSERRSASSRAASDLVRRASRRSHSSSWRAVIWPVLPMRMTTGARPRFTHSQNVKREMPRRLHHCLIFSSCFNVDTPVVRWSVPNNKNTPSAVCAWGDPNSASHQEKRLTVRSGDYLNGVLSLP